MQSELNLLKQCITELEAENIELKHENTKLKQIIEENVEFKAKIVKLERAIDKIEKRDQSISRAFSITKDNDSPTNSSLPVISQLSTPPPIEDRSDKDYSFGVNQLKTEPISPEDKVVDEFIDSIYREQVNNEIIQSIREKKLRDQNNTPNIETKEHLSQKRSGSESPNHNIYVSEESDEIEPTKSQYIEQGLTKESLSSSDIVSPASSEITEHQSSQIKHKA
ncbi:hypothetical protein C2G38_2284271 [Gigaspora rosea]|uniref:Uncharacterized protein n=1 Tax=Gigaspora rosea TaxID=44941 RepID=A0A397U2A1_9GLOM|nr:hypothetical protein C2G38_2284271 [Gigaspora rosea]